MNQPLNDDYKQILLNLPPNVKNVKAVNETFGDLDSVLLERLLANQDLPELVSTPNKLSVTPKNSLYITEIDNKFCFLDYTKGEQPIPTPFQTSDLDATESSASTLTANPDKQSKINSNSSIFLGKKGLLIGIGLGALLTLGATRLFIPATATSDGEPESASFTESIAPAQTVTTAEVVTTNIDSTLDLSGTVTAFERTPVMSQAAGLQITEVLAQRGDYVERGRVLARLNNRALMAQKTEAEGAVAQAEARLDELQAGSRVEEVAQAEARVANAKSTIVQAESELELVQKRVERNRTLEAEGAITRDELDDVLNQERVARSNLAGARANQQEAEQALAQLKAGSRPQTIAQAKAELTQARGRLEAVEAQLADTIVVAPTSGIIASREAKVGQITSASEMLFSIIQNGRLELRLQVPETLIGNIEPGQKVKISSNANPNLDLTGEVREIDPLIDESSRQGLVKVDLPNGTNLKPGMFLQAAINTDTNRGQVVPIEALLPQTGNSAIAFVVQDDNTVQAQTVEMGEILSGQRVEITKGLDSGDRIVLKGAAYLQDGDRVTVAN